MDLDIEITLDDLDLENVLKDKPKPPSSAKPIPVSPWTAVARVLVTEIVRCSCGAQYSAPAANGLLVRFNHKYKPTTWETANHPDLHNPNLPIETRTIERRVRGCLSCIHTAPQPGGEQLDMLKDWYEPIGCFLSETFVEVYEELRSADYHQPEFINDAGAEPRVNCQSCVHKNQDGNQPWCAMVLEPPRAWCQFFNGEENND